MSQGRHSTRGLPSGLGEQAGWVPKNRKAQDLWSHLVFWIYWCKTGSY
ncbi:rCG47077, isoform CRA_a [Rattus norvegicus]|uniref:RCG47077, isoform CRA_a n=1 Tax=Rattus norvegicus TaxID=10116 RepID=A6KQC1_RAT|nr:rCG47077, isoform CRA_a [Rattus norvegicus]